jgi:eukaryotic-like serine/threonine-protein kinase
MRERTVSERRDPLLGAMFDRRFRVEAKIAAGGFGSIYRATHLKSGHAYALKVLHANLISDPRVVARFRREGAALIRLRDLHTITAYELGEAPDGTLYIVMELLRGESLYERFRTRGALSWQQAFAIARAVCSSLAEAHALGIIHRDLKPTNIHLEPSRTGEDLVKVLDFGIAKIIHGSDIDSADLTHAGQMIGTLDYMSPEQMVGGMCTATSDIYTLGIVLYELMAGRKPFDDASSPAVALAAALTTTPDRLSVHAMVTPEVDRIVMRCLERAPADRFQSADELAAALDDVLLDGDEVVTRLARAPRGSDPGQHPDSPADARPTQSLLGPGARAQLDGTAALAASRSARGSRPTPTVPVPPATDHEATLLGHPPARRSAGTPKPIATPNEMPAAVSTNLRAVYPTIHRPPPSPMRPPSPSPFDDRASSSVSSVQPYRKARAARRGVSLGRVALLFGIFASGVAAALLLAGVV